MPLPETSASTTSRTRCAEPVREATTKSPEKDCPPAGRSAMSACQPAGSSGTLLCTRRRSRRSKSIVEPPHQGTPTRLRNCASIRPATPAAPITSAAPGVTPYV